MNVEYRSIPNYPMYRAGSDGSIWSYYSGEWKRLKGDKRKRDNKSRHNLKNANGLYDRLFTAHFILFAFTGPRPDGMEACHNDGNCLDDSKNNLRWDTHEGNTADKFIHGTIKYGENAPNAKLTDLEAIEIIKRRDTGETRESIIKDYDINSVSTINHILNRREYYDRVS